MSDKETGQGAPLGLYSGLFVVETTLIPGRRAKRTSRRRGKTYHGNEALMA